MKKLYKVIFEDRDNVYREYIPADNEEAAETYVAGNGDIISIKDVTEDFPISLAHLSNTLSKAGYGRPEMDAIIRIMQTYANAV
jgi:hypothetical protein